MMDFLTLIILMVIAFFLFAIGTALEDIIDKYCDKEKKKEIIKP